MDINDIGLYNTDPPSTQKNLYRLNNMVTIIGMTDFLFRSRLFKTRAYLRVRQLKAIKAFCKEGKHLLDTQASLADASIERDLHIMLGEESALQYAFRYELAALPTYQCHSRHEQYAHYLELLRAKDTPEAELDAAFIQLQVGLPQITSSWGCYEIREKDTPMGVPFYAQTARKANEFLELVHAAYQESPDEGKAKPNHAGLYALDFIPPREFTDEEKSKQQSLAKAIWKLLDNQPVAYPSIWPNEVF